MPESDKQDSAAAAISAGQYAHEFLKTSLARIFTQAENFTAGRYWALETLFLAVMFSVLFSGGVDDRLWSAVNGKFWASSYYLKIEHPLLDVAKINPPESHEAKLNFRLTVPVILHLLGVRTGCRWLLPILAACGSCALILISCVFASGVTGDRVCGLYTALAVSCSYIGSFGFMMYYDTIAISQVALAMLPGLHWSLKGVLVFTAAFTDERALPASLFVLLQSFFSRTVVRTFRECVLSADFLAVLAGMLGYCVTRLALEKFAGLVSPHEGTGFALLLSNAAFWHAGIWLALKGGWLMVIVATICLWQQRRIKFLAAMILAIGLIVGGGLLVDDVGRSVAYVLPGFLVALAVASAYEARYPMRVYCFAAFVTSAISGNYNVWMEQITWFRPLSVDFIYRVLHAILK